MEPDFADDTAGASWRAEADGEPARDIERHLLSALDGLSVGCFAQGLSAEEHGLWYFALWNWDGTLERIHHALYVEVREQAGREASPTAAIIDSQSAKGALKGGLLSMHRATMRARKSPAARGISSSTRLASC